MKKLTRIITVFLMSLLLMQTMHIPTKAQANMSGLEVAYFIFKDSKTGSVVAMPQVGKDYDLVVSFKEANPLANTASANDISLGYLSYSGLSLPNGSASVAIENFVKDSATNQVTFDAKFSNVRVTDENKAIHFTFNYLLDHTSSEADLIFKGKETPPQNEPERPGTVELGAPLIVITRAPLAKPIKAGETFEAELYIKNKFHQDIYDLVLKINPSDGLAIVNDINTYEIKTIGANQVYVFPITLKSSDTLSGKQALGVELSYNYYKDEHGILSTIAWSQSIDKYVALNGLTNLNISVVQGSTSATVEINTAADAGGASGQAAKPNIIISSFDFGSKSIDAGSTFPLVLNFRNTSNNRAIENIVMTVETGRFFAINGSTNTYHYTSLAAGGTLTQEIPLQALPTAETGSQPIELNFTYEVIENGQRVPSASNVKVSIPIVQPDRLEITEGKLPEIATVGEEMFLQLSYVNKGKAPVYNVSAKIEGDVDSYNKSQNVGNLDPGRSGEIGFSVIPKAAGEVSFTLIVEYEDANATVKRREFPMKIMAQEMMIPEGDPNQLPEFPMEEPAKFNMWLVIIPLVLILAIAGIVILRKKKQQSKQAVTWNEAWEDDTNTDNNTSDQKDE